MSLPDKAVATTRNTKTEGEAYDAGKRLRIALTEDWTHASFSTVRIGELTIEWLDEDGGHGTLTLGTKAIEILREVLG